MTWWGKAKSELTQQEKELKAFIMFEKGSGTIDVAQNVGLSVEAAKTLQERWAKQKTDVQTRVYIAFDQDKSIMAISTELGMKPEEVETLYKQYLKFQNRKEEIKKEQISGINAAKHYEPPYRIQKMIRNPYTGRGNKVEYCPMTFDEPCKTWTDFQSFAEANGNGEYIMTDVNGKRCGRYVVDGMGFSDPSELEEDGWGPNAFSNQNRMRRMMGRGRIGMGPMGPQGMGATYDPYGAPAQQYDDYGRPVADPAAMAATMERREAHAIYKQENRRRDLHYEVAELAARRGDVVTATKFLQMAEFGGPTDPVKEHKSFIDELIEGGGNEKKMEILKKIFGSGTEKEEKDDIPESLKKMKMIGDMASDLIPKIKDNIIDPVMDGISGESKSVSRLEREAGMTGEQYQPQGVNRGGNLGRGKWKAIQRIGGRPQASQPEIGDRVGPAPPRQQVEELPEFIPPRRRSPDTEVTEKVELAPDLIQSEDEVEELKQADDYGQPITKEELTKPINKVEHIDSKMLSIDEKWMLNNGFPRFRQTIANWIKAKEVGANEEEARFSPENTAREDYHEMTKSSKAIFIGKNRLLKAYHAAKIGPEKTIGSYSKYVEGELDKARQSGMDGMAEQLRNIGVKEFKKVWEPPQGLNQSAGIKLMLKYLVLKDCWNQFIAPEGKEWFTRYCAEFVKAVEEEHLTDNTRAKVRKMFEKPTKPVGGDVNELGKGKGQEGSGAAEPGPTAKTGETTGPANGTSGEPAKPSTTGTGTA